MKNVVVVAPHFLENTLRTVQAAVDLVGTRVAVISSDPASKIPERLRVQVEAHYRVENCLSGADLARACRWLEHRMGGIDTLIGALEQLQQPLAVAREACNIPGMGIEAATAFRDKTRMKDKLRAAGIPCARHRRIESERDLRSFITEVGLPIIVKPVDGLGSRSTHRVLNEEQLKAILKSFDPTPTRPLQAEEFIRGTERTYETVTVRGKPVWHCGTFYLPGPLEVLENPWIQYCVLLPREDDQDFKKFESINTAALEALGMDTGLSHMEWFVRRDGTYAVSEVGARPPGVHIMPMMSLTHDLDMAAAWVKLLVYGEFEGKPRKRAAGAAFFRGQGPGKRVVSVRGLDAANHEVGRYVVDRQLPVVGQAAATSYEGEGWAIVSHEDTNVVRQALQQLVHHVRVVLG